jgi:hypothetical protein
MEYLDVASRIARMLLFIDRVDIDVEQNRKTALKKLALANDDRLLAAILVYETNGSVESFKSTIDLLL